MPLWCPGSFACSSMHVALTYNVFYLDERSLHLVSHFLRFFLVLLGLIGLSTFGLYGCSSKVSQPKGKPSSFTVYKMFWFNRRSLSRKTEPIPRQFSSWVHFSHRKMKDVSVKGPNARRVVVVIRPTSLPASRPAVPTSRATRQK